MEAKKLRNENYENSREYFNVHNWKKIGDGLWILTASSRKRMIVALLVMRGKNFCDKFLLINYVEMKDFESIIVEDIWRLLDEKIPQKDFNGFILMKF